MSTHSNPQASSRLVSLPPEIRNLICSHCKEHERDVPIFWTKEKLPPYGLSMRDSTDLHYLSLTQTCRSLRNEFRPLYLANLDVCINIHEVDDFVDTFQLIENPSTDSITLRLKLKTKYGHFTEIAPIGKTLRVQQKFPGLKVVLCRTEHDAAGKRGFHKVSNVCYKQLGDDTWARYFSKAIQDIKITGIIETKLCVTIVVSPSYGNVWENTRGWPRLDWTKVWAKRIGLNFPEVLNVELEVAA